MMDDDVDNDRTHFRVKLGAAELEYRGREQFFKDEIMPTVGKILEMVESRADLQRPAAPLPQIEKAAAETVTPLPTGNDLDHSTNTVAMLLQAESTSGLAFAAAGHLTLVKKRDRITRSEILAEMKTATSFYKASDGSGNLSKALKKLVKDDLLRLAGDDTYALSIKGRRELEAALAKAE